MPGKAKALAKRPSIEYPDSDEAADEEAAAGVQQEEPAEEDEDEADEADEDEDVEEEAAAEKEPAESSSDWDASEIIKVLPKRCQSAPGSGARMKSYAVTPGDDIKRKVQVLLYKRAFDVWEASGKQLPDGPSLNNFGCVQIEWKQSIEEAWKLAADLAA